MSKERMSSGRRLIEFSQNMAGMEPMRKNRLTTPFAQDGLVVLLQPEGRHDLGAERVDGVHGHHLPVQRQMPKNTMRLA